MIRRVILAAWLLVWALGARGAVQACGRYRWAAKVLADGVRVAASYPLPAGVDGLRALRRPGGVEASDASRVGAERRVYRISGELLGFKLESDGDIHLIIAQAGRISNTMLAEIPDPRCMAGAPASLVRAVAGARLAFVQRFGIPPYMHYALAYRPLTLTGPAFYDALHGQDGAAPNGIEIHPVLSISP